MYGDWKLVSVGPDRIYAAHNLDPNVYAYWIALYGDTVDKGCNVTYDPQNGTFSWGNIMRSQANPAGIVPEFEPTPISSSEATPTPLAEP